MKKQTPAARRRHDKAELTARDRLPFIEHLRELRRRLLYIAVTVIAGGSVVYGFEHQIIGVLLRPSKGQELIYTSPMGGVNFLFTVCLDIGLVLATPVIIYQLLAFVRPLMRSTTRRFLLIASAAAGLMALAGVVFGYFVGLPSALHFLLNQFTTIQVRPLITIQSYTQFVALYLLGSALMFQLPLIVLLINRIKPLKPKTLLKYERHMVVGSLVLAFIMNPSPNLVDQMFVVVPIFASYQVAILLLWFVQHRNTQPIWLQHLREQDAERQAERISRPLTPLKIADAPALPVAETTEIVDETVWSVSPAEMSADTTPSNNTTAPAAKPKQQRRFMEFAPKTKPQLMPRRQIQIQIAT